MVNVGIYDAVLQIAGWDLVAPTQWGIVDSTSSPNSFNASLLSNFSRGRIQIVVSRGRLVRKATRCSGWFLILIKIYAYRILPPIIVVVLSSLLTVALALQDLAFRLTVTVTGMLSIVFLQYSFSW